MDGASSPSGAPTATPAIHGSRGRRSGKQTVESRGEAFIRDKVRKGSTVMPGFQFTLQPGQIDDIIAFLETYAPPARSRAAAEE
jgi:mono/diheme cytochrome c family protein